MIKATLNQLLQRAREFPNIAYPHRYSTPRNLSIMGEHRNYTKFIILGRSRSGSNFLRGMLNSHRRVIAFGELFQNEAEISWGLSGYRQSPQLLSLFHNDPIRFLEAEIFRKVAKPIQAVGFKLFYYHAHSKQWQPVWEYLAAQPTLKVIHIKRGNFLKTHLSRKRAMLTDHWVNLSGVKEHHPPIVLDYNECLEDFIQTKASEEKYDQFFASHPQLELRYEDLVHNNRTEINRVQDFLNIEHEVLVPETYKQSDDSLSTSIANYHELKDQFNGTIWHTFFEE